MIGINLILLQLFMIREFSIAVWSMELVILIITVAYFTGYSVGYFLSHRIPERWIRPWLLLVTVIHLPLVLFVRIIGAWLSRHNYDAAALPVVFGITALLLTSFYTVFLPRVIAGSGSTQRGVARAYSVELAGAAFGLALALVLGALWFEGIAVVYMISFIVMAWSLHYSRVVIASVTTLSTSVLLILFIANTKSIEYFYDDYYRWMKDPKVLYSAHSPYQRIDVIESHNGRSLYLNGLEYFNSEELESFNFFLSEMPARMIGARKPEALRSALVVGSGSMSSLHHLAPYVDEITTVEIDRMVSEAGKRFFAKYNRLNEVEDKWTLVIDDAKHFLSTTDKYFDLVVVDIPAPWYVQTGLLFTREFYELVKTRLEPDGILSVYVTQTVSLKRRKRISSQILAALLATFDDLVVVNAEDAPYGFVMAGDRLGFTQAQTRALIRKLKKYADFNVLNVRQVRSIVGNTPPASFDNLDIVWDINKGAF